MKTSIPTFFQKTILFFILLIATSAVGQKSTYESPYLIQWKVDGPLLGGALLSYGLGLNKIVSLGEPSEESVLNLDKNDLKLKINRTITGQSSEKANAASDVVLFASYGGAAALFAGSKKVRNNLLPTIVVFAEGYLYVRATTFLLKSTVLRFRPFAYNKDLPFKERQTKGATTSFISGHASTSTYMYFSTAKIFADHYPNAKAKPYIWTGAASLSLLTSYLRTQAGKHFVEDVAGGFAVGALFGILVPHFHKKAKEKSINQAKKTSLKIYPAEGGMLLSLKF
ncbi:MAG: membrane-associated phospholipid phosphatase [Saprospiraceae bacterium]|jgi:membrane-associated phospholipid phosphatase